MNTGASDEAIRQQAALWAVRVHEGDLSETDRQSMGRWLCGDPAHAREFREANASLAGLRDLPRPDAEHLVDLLQPGFQRRSSRFAGLCAAAAAAVLVAVVAGGAWLLTGHDRPAGDTFATATGESRTITFDDGSVAYLNTRTRLEWLGGSGDRRVSLIEGEALFDVVPDAERPFRVLLPGSEIRVLGTRFNVYRRTSGEVVVTVLEGKVRVEEQGRKDAGPAWTRSLHANQQIVYRPTGLMRDVHDTLAVNAVRWRDGVLQLQNEPLPEVLEELTRYTDRRILMRDDRLADYRVGGVISTRDVRAALARLEKLAPVAVTETPEGFALDYRFEKGADRTGDR